MLCNGLFRDFSFWFRAVDLTGFGLWGGRIRRVGGEGVLLGFVSCDSAGKLWV